MGTNVLPPFPHLSWLGAWTTVGAKAATLEFHLRQVNHCFLYSSGASASVRWIHHGREDRFRVDAGTVRFSPADHDEHTLIGRCDPGHGVYTLLVPPQHLAAVAAAEGMASVPELRHSVSRQDAVLTVCMRRLAEAARQTDGPSAEEQESAALSLLLRIMAMNGWRGPDWRNDSSVFVRGTLGNLVDHIDAHVRVAPSLGEMADLVAMSPSHFARKFRRSTGLSLHRFVNRRRIRKAVAMLQATSAPIAVIAAELGFASHSHFTRLFTTTTGMTPGGCRDQFGPVTD